MSMSREKAGVDSDAGKKVVSCCSVLVMVDVNYIYIVRVQYYITIILLAVSPPLILIFNLMVDLNLNVEDITLMMIILKLRILSSFVKYVCSSNMCIHLLIT